MNSLAEHLVLLLVTRKDDFFAASFSFVVFFLFMHNFYTAPFASTSLLLRGNSVYSCCDFFSQFHCFLVLKTWCSHWIVSFILNELRCIQQIIQTEMCGDGVMYEMTVAKTLSFAIRNRLKIDPTYNIMCFVADFIQTFLDWHFNEF